MKLGDVKGRLAGIDLGAGHDLIHELLEAYGTPQASITKLRSGTYDKAAADNETLWKRKVWDIYRPTASDDELLSLLDRAQANNDIGKLKPRFYIARNDTHLAAVDSRTGQTLDTPLTDLVKHAAFFMPWTGAEKTRTETISYVDTKVAKQMAKLYDEIIATNPHLPDTEDDRRNLNVFFSRLLFCFFAEDTGVFEDGIFTNALNNLTATDATDTTEFLDQLFEILDTPLDQRKNVPSHFEPFGYVNGSLFADRIEAPEFSRKARNIVIDCGTLDWTAINPDIFGSMIQAVTAGEHRANLGMHYTSVENILKVLNPLFLDDLEEQYEHAEDSTKKLQALHKHLGEIKVFDPACGSGNFLIVAYKKLRDLEHRILQRLVDLDGGEAPLFADSLISLENFYGIEIDDFAHDIAKLSLWFAKHQMNQEYDDLFGIERPLIPLNETGAIVCGNATRLEWETICPPTNNTYICGNPPYVGSSMQTAEQKGDLVNYFGDRYPKKIDYISIWFLKSADWITETGTAAFVATNSICQGLHVDLLWTRLLSKGVHIGFAHTSFNWTNSAIGKAGVTCIVVGLTRSADGPRRLIEGGIHRIVPNISPYLVSNQFNTIVRKVSFTSHDRPTMKIGNVPKDDGHLIYEVNEAVEADTDVRRYLKPFVGAIEMLHSKRRFCLWIEDQEAENAGRIEEIQSRVASVRSFRSSSTSPDTRKSSDSPHRFFRTSYESTPCIAIPRVSSERRDYIPIGFFPEGTVLSDRVYAIYGAPSWLFALLQASMHVAWIGAVCVRLRMDYSYSNTLGYNTFPFPALDHQARTDLGSLALAILAARERWPDRSLAELYDPDKMPANLRAAHEENDAYVDSLYRSKPFTSDADRMELLLAMYRDLVAEDESKKSKSEKEG